MDIYDRIKTICALRKISEIAEKLKVSSDYLIGITSFIQCECCGKSYDPSNNYQCNSHGIFHEKYLKVIEKYPFFLNYQKADKQRTDSIYNLRNPQKSIEEKLKSFDLYLEAAFSIEINENGMVLENLDYDQFCKTEVSTFYPDEFVSQDFIDILIDKYEVDRNFLSGNEQLLARISKNERIIRLAKYAEHIRPEMLDAIEIQMKALSEQNKKE